MAKNRIKGITIEIGGDTTELERSLKGVDSSLKTTQSTLKDVNKLLKLDPTNFDLLRQKGELLKTSIADTNQRLKTLKDAYKNLKADTPEELKQKQDALKREIAETEQSLKSLKDQYQQFGSVARQELNVAGEKMKEVGGKMTAIGGQLTAKVTAPLVAGFTLATNSASDYEENLNKLQVAFGDYADEVRAFTDNAQIDYGLSMKDASDSASAFGALAKGIGLSEEQAASMSVELTKLSADLGSYFNTDIETSAGALEGIFTGNAQSLKQFGVVMTDTNLKEFAEELGMTAKQYANLGSEEKTLLRFQYVMAQTTDAQGDFARTNDGIANSTKSLQASFSDLLTVIGEQLIPIVTPVIQKITEVISSLSQLDSGTLQTIVQIGLVVAALGPVLSILGTLVSSIGAITQGIGFLFSPMGAIVVAIGAVVAAGVALYQNWDTIKAKCVEIWDKIKADFEAVKTFFVDAINAIVEKFNSIKESIANAFSFEGIKSRVSGFLGSIGGLFGSGGFASSGFASGGFSSGGMMSSSITLNNTFSISSQNVTESMVRSWADVLTEQINENLGRMV